tara:strand:- start:7606 stop:7890 length:285 start_codon:yes stop_codon:yes gene_type:complete
MEPIGSSTLYNAYDINFIVRDDLYNQDPTTETTVELGKAIDKWNYQEQTMISNFEVQLVKMDEMKKSQSIRLKDKLLKTTAMIIQNSIQMFKKK